MKPNVFLKLRLLFQWKGRWSYVTMKYFSLGGIIMICQVTIILPILQKSAWWQGGLKWRGWIQMLTIGQSCSQLLVIPVSVKPVSENKSVDLFRAPSSFYSRIGKKIYRNQNRMEKEAPSFLLLLPSPYLGAVLLISLCSSFLCTGEMAFLIDVVQFHGFLRHCWLTAGPAW